MEIELINMTENFIENAAKAARTSYDSDTEAKTLIKHIFKTEHMSILEFIDVHFRIKNVSRITTHQLVRHRHFSFNQRSQRYVDENNFNVRLPTSIAINKKAREKYFNEVENIRETYKELQDLGIPNEDARYILPEGTYSEIHFKGNFRSLIEFCNKRLCNRSQDEIREVAYGIKKIIEGKSEFLAEQLVPKCEKLGYCPEGKKSCGYYPLKSEVLGE